MSALGAGRVTPEWVPNTIIRSYKMKANTQIWEGGIVAVGSDGYAVPGATSTSQVTVGIAQESKLSGSSDGDTLILVHVGVFYVPTDATFDVTAIGSAVYTVNDQQVSLTGTGRSLAGVVEAVDGTANAWVRIGLNPPNQDALVTAFEASLAATTSGSGAALVGNAGIAQQVTARVILSAAITNAVMYRFTPIVAGKISKLSASVVVPATTTGKAVTLAAQISGVALGGGALALTQANCATLGAAVSGTAVTSANTFTAGQEITIVTSSITAFAEGEVILNLFLAPN